LLFLRQCSHICDFYYHFIGALKGTFVEASEPVELLKSFGLVEVVELLRLVEAVEFPKVVDLLKSSEVVELLKEVRLELIDLLGSTTVSKDGVGCRVIDGVLGPSSSVMAKREEVVNKLVVKAKINLYFNSISFLQKTITH